MNKKWKFHKLTDISKPKQWQNLPVSALTHTGYLVYGANGIIGRYTKYNHEQPVIAITCRGATCGNVLITEPKSFITSNAMVLDEVDEEQIHLKFLLFALRKRGFNDVISGSAQPQITRTNLEKIQIPLPPLPEQIHIANVLSKAEALIAKRKESLALLDAYLKSTFLEMFGELIYCSDENLEPIGQLADFIDYRGKTQERTESGVPLISAKCVRKGYFDSTRLDYITEETFQKIMTRGFPRPNDVLFTTEGATMGFVCRIPKTLFKFAVGQRIITLQCKEKICPEYLDFILNHSTTQKRIFKRASGSAAIGIRSAEFEEVVIPVPPLELQNQFAAVVEKVEALKERYQESLGELEALYGALSQRAFRGELGIDKED